MRALALFVPVLLLSAPAGGAECSARSGPNAAALVELYTSEGCSSCPPADRWLTRFPASGAGADVIALAFHVDYWDYIGWKDRLASPAWSERQREAVRRSGGRIVYTPQVMVNGKDFRAWNSGTQFRESVGKALAKPSPVDLSLRATQDGQHLKVFVEAASKSAGIEGAELVLALAESRIVTEVKAGENRGEKLAHDHVVRALAPVGRIGKQGRLAIDREFPLAPGWKPADLSVTAFVQDPRTGEVSQALRLACAS